MLDFNNKYRLLIIIIFASQIHFVDNKITKWEGKRKSAQWEDFIFNYCGGGTRRSGRNLARHSRKFTESYQNYYLKRMYKMLLRNLAPILTPTKNWTGVELLCAILLTHIKVSNLGMVLTFSVTIGIIVAWCALLILSKYLFIFSPLFFFVNVTTPNKRYTNFKLSKKSERGIYGKFKKKFFLALLVYSTHIIQMSLFEESPPPVPSQNKVSDTTHFDGHCLWHFGENKKLCKLSLRAETKGKLGFLREQIANKELYSIIIIRKGKNVVTFGWENPIRRNNYDNVASPPYILLRPKFKNMGQGTTVIIW